MVPTLIRFDAIYIQIKVAYFHYNYFEYSCIQATFKLDSAAAIAKATMYSNLSYDIGMKQWNLIEKYFPMTASFNVTKAKVSNGCKYAIGICTMLFKLQKKKKENEN